MLKVFILGYEEPHSVVGNFLFEDERFLYLDDAGKKIKIPHKRVAYIEDWAAYSPESVQMPQPTESPFVVSKTSKSQEMSSNKPMTSQQINDTLVSMPPQDATKIGDQLKSMLAQRLAEQQRDALRSSQVEPEDIEQDIPLNLSGQQTELQLIFTGAKSGQFPLFVPSELFTGQYTPAIGRKIFTLPEVQVFMSSDIILDGLPIVRGTSILFKTKPAKTLGEITSKMDVLGKMLSVGNSNILNKNTRTSPFESGFSMPGSPFDKVPIILNQPKDDTEE